MLYWVNFLHIYQPPNQDLQTLRDVASQSYRLILRLLEKYPKFCVTLNISGSLLEQMEADEFRDVIDGFKKNVGEGRIELVGSAMYHPILTLLPADEIERQIRLHEKICKKVFGDLYNPKGFFIPEMAYGEEVGKVIKNFGFSWIILDEAHGGGNPDPEVKYEIEGLGLGVIFRNRKFSKSFPPEYILEHMS